jgi:glycosyltransferase involved in cell wall biosynthesis
MTVLQIYKDYYPSVNGGNECHVNLLFNGLRKKRVDVEVLVSNTSSCYQEETYNSIKVFKVPQRKRFYLAPLTLTLNSYLRRLGKAAYIKYFHNPSPSAKSSYPSSILYKDLNCLVNNAAKRKCFVASGKLRFKEMFSAEAMVSSTLKFYDEVLTDGSRYPVKAKLQKCDSVQRSKKIKILRVVSRLNISGPTLNVKYLTEGLNSETYETRLVSGTISPNEGDMSYITRFDRDIQIDVPELQREINIIKDTIALFKVLKIVFKYRPDIIHSHTSKAGTIARCAAMVFNLLSKEKTIIVHTYHGHVLEGYFSALKSKLVFIIERMLARTTDAIIAISQTQKWELTEKYHLASVEKIHTINLGFDLSRFLDISDKGTLRSTFGVDDQIPVIGIVGRLAPIKNHRLFLDAAKLIIARYTDKAIRFAIIGDGELMDSLRAYTQAIGIEHNVIFYGWEKKIERIYADLDILVLTSNNEGTPVSIIESMAASVPVVTTGVGGVKDLLGRIETRAQTKDDFSICERGILCPKGNATAIARGIQYLIESENQSLVSKAREYVFKNYTEKRLIEKTENLYKNLI